MKKAIIRFIVIFVLGILTGLYIFKENIFSIKLRAFEVGYYNNIDEALQKQKEISNSAIINDGDNYRVVVSVLNNEKAISKMSEYLQSKLISYYIEEINTPSLRFIDVLNNYEMLIINGSSDTYDDVNKNILSNF